jgi:hypothetical protein
MVLLLERDTRENFPNPRLGIKIEDIEVFPSSFTISHAGSMTLRHSVE